MLRKILHSIFLQNRSVSKLNYSCFSNEKKQQSIEAQKEQQRLREEERKRKLFEEDEDDKYEEPEYEKEDRSTLGWTIYRIFFWGTTALFSWNLYLVANHNKKTPVENETGAIPGMIQGAKVAYQMYGEATEFMTMPPTKKLLPDVVHPLIHPKTLVLNLSGTLVDTQYVFGKGVNIRKRPGLANFLKKMSQHYEIVIFSDDDSMFIESVLPSLDPRQQMISGFFGRECMVWSKGRYIKDLKYLNRDARKVIVIDKNSQVVRKNKENVIVLSPFNGQEEDSQLLKLSFLLESLSRPEVGDVRKAITKMGENPLQKYGQILRQKQQKFQSSKGSKLFDIFKKK